MDNLAHDTHTPWWTPLGLQPVRDGGPLNPVMKELVTWLIDQGYATTTMHNIIRAAGRVGDWMTRDTLTLDDLTTETLPTLVTRDNHSYPAHRVANESTSAVHRFLLATGRLAAPTCATPTASSRSAHGYLDDWCATLADAGYGSSWLHKAHIWMTPFLRSVEDGSDPRKVDTDVASMMVRFPASATPVIVKPISAVRQMVSATRLKVRLHSRVLVRLGESVATLILYRPGPLHVVPPRTPPRGQLWALRNAKSQFD